MSTLLQKILWGREFSLLDIIIMCEYSRGEDTVFLTMYSMNSAADQCAQEPVNCIKYIGFLMAAFSPSHCPLTENSWGKKRRNIIKSLEVA